MRPPIRLFALLLPLLLLGCQKQTQAQHAQGMDKPAAQTSSQTSTAQAITAEINPLNMDKRESQRQQAAKQDVNKPSISPKGEGMMLQGTVRYLNLEGGFWGIVADNGQKILPKNLPQEYRKDGIRLSFTALEITGMMTIQQWGKLSNLSDITVIGQVESQSADPRL
ncbi:hypothetical protein [Shewanella xiamenensis]|uniref:hypothetical protein n=1 Tax=Shewanella xiamenensis TaxID=332186 RepID=UPI0024A668C3|nr:hypothetical protein [Shewanella xiamenensis]MDI5838190.1 hypothetical protein [Shewanella xiamenensis]MDI5842134.1 hypothetical protein [Shewanella xiamenensis]MDI5846075.1 hypothetical protein [Shewanella xiamenensis]MDI5854020.1 hypothetical protein [Shewanella xiamenensis]MDI5857976.1 hypothetical protein [Shewanella xiamenensis]